MRCLARSSCVSNRSLQTLHKAASPSPDWVSASLMSPPFQPFRRKLGVRIVCQRRFVFDFFRAVDFVAMDFFAPLFRLAVDFFAVDFFAPLFRLAVDFFAVDFFAPLFRLAVDFFAVDFLAPLFRLAVDFFLAEGFRLAVDFLGAGFFLAEGFRELGFLADGLFEECPRPWRPALSRSQRRRRPYRPLPLRDHQRGPPPRLERCRSPSPSCPLACRSSLSP